MSIKYFNNHWVRKFSKCLDKVVGVEIRREVVQSFVEHLPYSFEQDVIEWTKDILYRLENLVNEEKQQDILTGCVCHDPTSKLKHLK